MPEPIEVGLVSYTLSADTYARIGADFDTEAVDDAILARLNELVPPAWSCTATARRSPSPTSPRSPATSTGSTCSRRSTSTRSSPTTAAEPGCRGAPRPARPIGLDGVVSPARRQAATASASRRAIPLGT